MNTKTIKTGAVVGAVAGMAMAMWSMIAFAATGDGFWRPVNGIAHVVWRGAPLDGSFNFAALVIGMMLHMAMSMMLGVVIVAAPSTTSRFGRAATALVVPMVVWIVQLGVWRVVDKEGSALLEGWVFFVAHLMYSMVVVIAVRRLSADAAELSPGTSATSPSSI